LGFKENLFISPFFIFVLLLQYEELTTFLGRTIECDPNAFAESVKLKNRNPFDFLEKIPLFPLRRISNTINMTFGSGPPFLCPYGKERVTFLFYCDPKREAWIPRGFNNPVKSHKAYFNQNFTQF